MKKVFGIIVMAVILFVACNKEQTQTVKYEVKAPSDCLILKKDNDGFSENFSASGYWEAESVTTGSGLVYLEATSENEGDTLILNIYVDGEHMETDTGVNQSTASYLIRNQN